MSDFKINPFTGDLDRVLDATDIGALGFVPYTGATANVDLGVYDLTTTGQGTFGLGLIDAGNTASAVPLTVWGNKTGDVMQVRLGYYKTGNGAINIGGFSARHYIDAEEDVAALYYVGTATGNTLGWGGGSNAHNAARIHNFYTAANDTTLQGTIRFKIDGNGDVSIPADSKKFMWGTANDSYIEFDGNSMNIVANAVTAGDNLNITANLVNLDTTSASFGDGTNDFSLTFNGGNDSVLTWLEDEQVVNLKLKGSSYYDDGGQTSGLTVNDTVAGAEFRSAFGAWIKASADGVSAARGFFGGVYDQSTTGKNIGYAYGAIGQNNYAATNARQISYSYGGEFTNDVISAQNLTMLGAYGLYARALTAGHATNAITTAIGAYIDEPGASNSITNNYVLYLADATRGSSDNYSLYSDGPILAKKNIIIDSDSYGLILGDGQDTEIYYDGSQLVIDDTTNQLISIEDNRLIADPNSVASGLVGTNNTLLVGRTETSASGSGMALGFAITDGAATPNLLGTFGGVRINRAGDFAHSGIVAGGYNFVGTTGSGTLSSTIANVRGMYAQVDADGGFLGSNPTWTNVEGVTAEIDADSVDITNLAFFKAIDTGISATPTTAYGLYLPDINMGSTNYAIWSGGGDVELTDGNLTTTGLGSFGTLAVTTPFVTITYPSSVSTYKIDYNAGAVNAKFVLDQSGTELAKMEWLGGGSGDSVYTNIMSGHHVFTDTSNTITIDPTDIKGIQIAAEGTFKIITSGGIALFEEVTGITSYAFDNFVACANGYADNDTATASYNFANGLTAEIIGGLASMTFDSSGSGESQFLNEMSGDYSFKGQSATQHLKFGDTTGSFKIYPNAVGDVTMFDTTDVDDVADGKSLYVHRKAVEGDESWRMYTDNARIGKLVHTGSVEFEGDDFDFNNEIVVGGGAAGQSIIASGLVVNEDSGGTAADDFRVETTSQASAFLVDASADQIDIAVPVNLDEALTVNDSSADKDTRVESNGEEYMLFVDGGNDHVSVGGNANITNSRFAVETETTEGTVAITIDQEDDDEGFIDFKGATAASIANNISTLENGGDSSSHTVAGPKAGGDGNWIHSGMVRVSIDGADGGGNDGYWIPYYSNVAP